MVRYVGLIDYSKRPTLGVLGLFWDLNFYGINRGILKGKKYGLVQRFDIGIELWQ